MFNPKNEVPDLKLCKKLQELGYPQETGGWYWLISTGFKGTPKYTICFLENFNSTAYIPYPYRYIKAPTNVELGKYLILQNEAYYTVYSKQGYFCKSIDVNGLEDEYMWTLDKKETNARAKMLIWLVKNKCIKFL